MKKFAEDLILFVIFGLMYYLLESLWKYPNPSHYTMIIIGGIMGIVVGGLNERMSWEIPLHL